MVHVEGSRAVETYLRNFTDEKAHNQKILDITLCYGVQCLSRTFSLKGMSCHELRTITGYDAAKNQDYYVRNASPSVDKRGGRRPLEVRTKPSHAWRDGEVSMPSFSTSSAVAEATLQSTGDIETENGALYSLNSPAFDEIDYLTNLLGKSLVDLMWKMFAGKKGSQITTREELDEKFVRVDRRKTVAMIPPLELPVTSFADFLGTYVIECVRQAQQMGCTDNNESGGGQESICAVRGASLDSPSLPSVKKGRRRNASNSHAAIGKTKPAEFIRVDTEQKQRPLRPQPRPQQPQQVSRSTQRGQPKIQPEPRAQRQKLLRVKKTQSQRMAEALARARLAEYDARRKQQDMRDRRLAPKKILIRDITTGAAALEIVDNFMKSPLMDKFGRGHMPESGGTTPLATNRTQPRSEQNDPLEEELYGTTALDHSFLGRKPEPRHRSESQPKQRRRKYDGWLGDFGSLHTQTVRPKWNEDDAAEPDSQEPSSSGILSIFPVTRANFDGMASDKGPTQEINDLDDGEGDALSEISDPVFRWLEGAV